MLKRLVICLDSENDGIIFIRVHRFIFAKIMQYHISDGPNSCSQLWAYSFLLARGGQVMLFCPIRHKFMLLCGSWESIAIPDIDIVSPPSFF